MKNLLMMILILVLSACSSVAPSRSEVFPTTINRAAFLKLEVGITPEFCVDGLCVKPLKVMPFGRASAFSIKQSGEDMYALTAGHVCHEEGVGEEVAPGAKMALQIRAFDLFGEEYEASITSLDLENDLCLLKVDGLQGPTLPLAMHGPDIGDKVFSMMAPLGLAKKNMVPLYTGFYSGKYENFNMEAFYTLPCTGGSSGSPIMNSSGEVIGVISMGGTTFKHFTLSPSLSTIRTFLEPTPVSHVVLPTEVPDIGFALFFE